MSRRMLYTVEKVGGVPQKRAACSHCGWVSELRGIRGFIFQRMDRGVPANREAVREEFRNHECEAFPAGTRRWRFKNW